MLDSASGAVDGGERRARPPSEWTQCQEDCELVETGLGRQRLPWAGIWAVGRRVRLRGQWPGKPAPAERPVGTSCPQGTDPGPTVARRTPKVSSVPSGAWRG